MSERHGGNMITDLKPAINPPWTAWEVLCRGASAQSFRKCSGALKGQTGSLRSAGRWVRRAQLWTRGPGSCGLWTGWHAEMQWKAFSWACVYGMGKGPRMLRGDHVSVVCVSPSCFTSPSKPPPHMFASTCIWGCERASQGNPSTA